MTVQQLLDASITAEEHKEVIGSNKGSILNHHNHHQVVMDNHDDDVNTISEEEDEDEGEESELPSQASALLKQAHSLSRMIESLLANAAALKRPTKRDRISFTEGLQKLLSMVRGERRFLEKLLKDPQRIQPSHVQCSNLEFLESVLTLAMDPTNQVTHIFHTLPVSSSSPSASLSGKVNGTTGTTTTKQKPGSVRVDVVMNGGTQWVKVKASSLRGTAVEMNGEEEDDDDDDDEEEESEEYDDQEDEEEDDNDEKDGTEERTTSSNKTPNTSNSCTDSEDQNGGQQQQYSENEKENSVTLPASLPIFKQAAMLLRAARQHLVGYTPPKVVFAFFLDTTDTPVDERIIKGLEGMGVSVQYHPKKTENNNSAGLIPVPSVATAAESEIPTSSHQIHNVHHDNHNNHHIQQQQQHLEHLIKSTPSALVTRTAGDPPPPDSKIWTSTFNLDTTALIALVSDLSNLHPSQIPESAFDVPAIRLQRQQELATPLFPSLLPYLAPPRKLVACRTAVERFVEILKVVGGRKERRRAVMLFDWTAMDKEAVDWLENCLRDVVVVDDSGLMMMVNTLRKKTDLEGMTGDSVQKVEVECEWIRNMSHPQVPFARVLLVPDQPSLRFLPYLKSDGEDENSPPVATAMTSADIAASGNVTQTAASLAKNQTNFNTPSPPPSQPPSKPIATNNKKKNNNKKQQDNDSINISHVNSLVFGTGDKLLSTTVTANSGLTRSFRQNVHMSGVSVFVFSPRSLVEARPEWSKRVVRG